MKKKYVWHQQSISPDFKMIDCPVYDGIKDFHRDPTGVYVLIRCDLSTGIIEVAVCDKKHTILNTFKGRKAQDLYFTIFEFEKRHQLKWFSRKDHLAYLGKELKKCEIAIRDQEEYVQE